MMNFLDNDYLTGSSTPTSNPREQSLNEEVSQVIGQLGRFWGGLRRQSQSALELARKDLGDVVSHAQKELSKLTSDTVTEPPQEKTSTPEAEGDAQAGPSSQSETPVASTSTDRDLSSSSLFARLQSALPPNIVSTVHSNLPETLKHATENIDLSQLRTTLSNEFQRVQGATMAQAGEYVQKSEGLLREAMKEAGDVLRDAVKVIPPEEADSTGNAPGVLWDGSDIWMLPSPAGELSDGGGKGKGKEKEKEKESGLFSGRPSAEAQRAVATRAEFLLKQLKHNPAILKHDPEADVRVCKLYNSWVETEVEAKKGGMEGDEWIAMVSNALSEPGDGQALQTSFDTLVPSEISKETFWKRYFFRIYQIKREEQKRRALLQGLENEEIFSWEDDDEEAMSPTPAAKSLSSSQEQFSHTLPDHQSGTGIPSSPSQETFRTVRKHTGEPEKDAPPSLPQSPRESSEDSYDLLSSENLSASGESKDAEKQSNGDDPDSDWE